MELRDLFSHELVQVRVAGLRPLVALVVHAFADPPRLPALLKVVHMHLVDCYRALQVALLHVFFDPEEAVVVLEERTHLFLVQSLHIVVGAQHVYLNVAFLSGSGRVPAEVQVQLQNLGPHTRLDCSQSS